MTAPFNVLASDFSPYPPIADYAFLSDCEVTALVAPSSAIEWLCLPKMDAPSVFGAILDRDAGRFIFGPENMSVPADRRYLPGTLVVETSWDCRDGWIIVRDSLIMGPWRHSHPETSSHTRSPTDYDAEHILLRTVRCVNGSVQLIMNCEPVFDYGRVRENWQRTDREFYQTAVTHDDLTLTLTSDIRIGIEGPSARARTLLREGDTRFCALSWGSMPPPHSHEEAYRRQVWTAFASDSRNPAMPAIPTQVFKVISTGLSQFVSRGPARARWRSRSPMLSVYRRISRPRFSSPNNTHDGVRALGGGG